MSWYYTAHSIDGKNPEKLLYNELPLSDVEISRNLDGTGSLTATISPEIPYLQGSGGRFMLEPWGTVISAVKDGRVHFSGILSILAEDGPVLSLTVVPFSQYAKGLPYLAKFRVYDRAIDSVIRTVWSHIQSQPQGNVRLSVRTDATSETVGVKTYKRVQKERTVTKKVNGKNKKVKETYYVNEVDQDEPFEMNPWSTSDLDQILTQLCDTADFHPIETHTLKNDVLSHKLEYKLDKNVGKTRNDLRFVLGENVFTVLPIDYMGDYYASEIWIQGAGDGDKAIRERAYRTPGDRLRRVVTVSDTALNSRKVAKARADKELKARTLAGEFSGEVVVHNHPNAALGTYDLGDSIFIQSEGGWADAFKTWCYITEMKIDPQTEEVTLTVQRIEKRGLDNG